MTTLRAKGGFTAYLPNGQQIQVADGRLLDSNHPVVKGRENLFEDVTDRVDSLGREKRFDDTSPKTEVLMERATADPDQPRPTPKPKVEPEKPKTATRTPVAKGKQDGEV